MENFNPQTETKWTPFKACAVAEGFDGEEPTKEQYVEAWAYLISTGMAWNLQGWYGRTANGLIENGVIAADGHIDWELAEAL